MVSFRNFFTAALAFSVPISAAITPAEVVTNIESITQKSMALQTPAKSVTVISGQLLLIGQGPFPEIIRGFADIVTTATTAIAQMQGMPKEPAGASTDAVFEAFREVSTICSADIHVAYDEKQFVRVHQALLNILIGKAGLFSTLPFVGAPVAAVLRQIEKVVDTIAFMLIDTFEARAADFKDEAGALSGTLTVCINQYQGITTGITKRNLRFARREMVAAA
ncbi:uncharacterized protein J4E87_002391 [Alternaria ethzedia]|uniref:uncharacterized protein n=1 Tax=Alternaria ethzedia TaxID=181014 RepID=UPI0020C526BA|nr:uncharacterized protein J4E87_002391 [Alternaria ethzedia]KAI4631685.1 hypothetical protein J4E87_002391 [Alternaria ethzedia]